MELPWINGVATFAGVTSHVLFFRQNEHHMYALRYIQIFLATFASVVALLVSIEHDSIRHATIKVGSISAFYLSGVYTSLLFYRTVLHPLNKFPGPFGARVSSFWLPLQIRNADGFKRVKILHDKYGEFVRVGSSDLSITNPKAVHAIYGPGTKCTKGSWYDQFLPLVSMHTYRDRAQHDRRRRVWSPAFSDKALRGYEQRMSRFLDQLVAKMTTLAGQPVNVKSWFNRYTYDIMGDLSFGTSFDMLESKDEHFAIKILNEGVSTLGLLIPIWFAKLMMSISSAMGEWERFVEFCLGQLTARMSRKEPIPDILTTLLAPFGDWKPTQAEMHLLQAESQLIIIAGSDTTAAALVYIFYELLRHPEHIKTLREEMASHVLDKEHISHLELQHLDHLNGVINESLRLHPSVPTAAQRLTPPEGIDIDGIHIPGNMTVWCPQYVVGRSEKAYDRPDDFVPERWYSRPEMVKEKTAFSPFMTGPYSCIGKPLALQTMRLTIAKLLMNFDICFAPGEDGDSVEAETRDYFIAQPGDLDVRFSKREVV
ncbi:hypothetical protein AJ80_00130 [Polytolypa hystricis UAMH7299]|uniref:Cytochrome P450 monooxygenase n=1 Tax=Polytolypa hystricis (strain UAMH7299) TaxID=1447883 RepID=A0A2B7Z4R5_POLH7|nr:hypothetical protein AJ80_00130 [Polytolypa hystricis UAMH7299]